MPNYYYATVIEALDKLRKKGYTVDFNLQDVAIASHPENYKITEIYRYEGDTDPDEESFVFGIEANTGEKGVFVMGAAAASEGNVAKFLHDIDFKNGDSSTKK
ncbi:MAG TPA: hypothetical protein PKL92_02810 [Aquaticitalea sp.]|nr:hypothetical protein [Aquaticitalea sp.]HNU58875.1 hypothetical protein [Aquaticitalea sp.]